MAFSISSGIEELNPVGMDEVPVTLAARLLVVPGFGTFAAFEVNARALVKAFAGDFCQAIEGFHGKPFRMLLQFAVFILPSFRGGDGELCDGRTLLSVLHFRITAEISDQHYFLHGVIAPFYLFSCLPATSTRLYSRKSYSGSRFRSAPSANRRCCRRARLPSG